MNYKFTLLLFAFFFIFSTSGSSLWAQTRGKASFYSNSFNGRKMSNGEYYDSSKFTCAHKKLPYGTLLKVKNLKNDKEVIVKVTDRGPHAKGRMIDLSRIAAKEIEMIAQGIGTVEITVLENEMDFINYLKSSDKDITTLIPYQDFYLKTERITPYNLVLNLSKK